MGRKHLSKNLKYSLLLLTLILFFTINNYIWISKYSFSPFYPDESTHLIQSLKFYQIFRTHPLKGILQWYLGNYRQPFPSYSYPPLFPLSSAIFNLFFGTSKIASTMVNTIYLIIIIFSIYLLGIRLTKNHNIGLLSAFILSIYPIIFGYQRFFMIEFALTTVVTINVLCLLYTENFTNRKFSLIFGIVSGLGMLTKWSFSLFLIGPFIFNSWQGLKIKKSTLLNILTSLIIAFFISLIYYNHPINWLKVWLTGKFYGYISTSIQQTSVRTFGGSTFYLRSLFWQLTPLLYFLFLGSFILFLKSNIKYKLFLISWLLCPFTILTFISNKWPRHIMPSLPAIALITAIGIFQIRRKNLKTLTITSVLIIGLTQYFVVSYSKIIEHIPYSFMYQVTPLSDKEIKLREIVKQIIPNYIIPYTQNAKEKLQIGVVDTIPQMILADALMYSVIQKNLNCQIISLHRNYFSFLKEKNKFDFLIIIRNKSIPLPTKSEIQNFFKSEKIDKFLNLKGTEYGLFAQELKNLIENMELVEIIEAPFDVEYNKIYFYIFRKFK